MSESSEYNSETEAVWGLEDYAVLVPMTDKFYKNLKFAKITIADFHSGDYTPQPRYSDSRTYIRPLLEALLDAGGLPAVYDVGGYVGRFSIEAALAVKSLGLDSQIVCFEPGETGGLLLRNIELNHLSNYISVQRLAVSNVSAQVEFAVASDAKITSRIVPDKFQTIKVLGERWTQKTVESICLQDYMINNAEPEDRPFICKIDTEGHEVEVIEGIGENRLVKAPNALIVEYRPALSEKTLFGQNFEQFICAYYHVFDIRNSLYPAGFSVHENFDTVKKKFSGTALDNVDLLLVRKTIPDAISVLAPLA